MDSQNKFSLRDADRDTRSFDRSIPPLPETLSDAKIVFDYLVALQDKNLTKHQLEERFYEPTSLALKDIFAVEMVAYFLRYCDYHSLTRLKKILHATMSSSSEASSSRLLRRTRRQQLRQSKMQSAESSDEDAPLVYSWFSIDDQEEVNVDEAAKEVLPDTIYTFSYLDTWVFCDALLGYFSIALKTNLNDSQRIRIAACCKKLLAPIDYLLFAAHQQTHMESEEESMEENRLLEISTALSRQSSEGFVPHTAHFSAATTRVTQKLAEETATVQAERADEFEQEHIKHDAAEEWGAPKGLKLIQKRLQSCIDLYLATQNFFEKAPDAKTLAIFRWLNDCYDHVTEKKLEHYFRKSLFQGDAFSIEIMMTYFLRSASAAVLNLLQARVNDFSHTMGSVRLGLSHTRVYPAIIQATCAAIAQVFAQHIPRDAVTNQVRYAFFLDSNDTTLRLRALIRLHEACQQELCALSGYDQNDDSVSRPVISSSIAHVAPFANLSCAKKLTAIAVTINYFFLMCVYIYFNWRWVLRSLLDTQRWLDIHTANTDDDTPSLTDVTSNFTENITSLIAFLLSLNELCAILMTHTPLHNAYGFLMREKQTKSWSRQLLIETPIFLSRFLMHISSSFAVAGLIDHYESREKKSFTIVAFSIMMTFSFISTVFFSTPKHRRQGIFNQFIFDSIRMFPELSLQAGGMLLGFTCAQALLIMIMAQQSAVLLSDVEETNPYILAAMLCVAIVGFFGVFFSQAAAIFHHFIRPEYLTLIKDNISLSCVRPIQKSQLFWDIAKQLVFREVILIAMIAMLIQGDFAKPSALRLFFILFSAVFFLAQSIYCSYRRKLFDNLVAAPPSLIVQRSIDIDDMNTDFRLTATEKAKKAIDTYISQLTQKKWRLPWYKLVISYMSALNRTLILPFVVVQLNDLLVYFNCALDVEQMIALTVLLGFSLMNWTVTYHHKRMYATADFIRLLHNMKLFNAENVGLTVNEDTPLIPRNSSRNALHRSTRDNFRDRDISQDAFAEEVEQVAQPSFFQALRLNLTDTYYRYSVNDWLALGAVENEENQQQPLECVV